MDLIGEGACENTGRGRRRPGEPPGCEACLTLSEGDGRKVECKHPGLPCSVDRLGKGLRECLSQSEPSEEPHVSQEQAARYLCCTWPLAGSSLREAGKHGLSADVMMGSEHSVGNWG